MSRLTRRAGYHLRQTYRLLRGNRRATEDVHRDVKETHKATMDLHPLLDLLNLAPDDNLRHLPGFLRNMLADMLDTLKGIWTEIGEMKTSLRDIPDQLAAIRREQQELRRRQDALAEHLGQPLD